MFFPGSSQKPSYENGIEIHDNYGNNERVGWNHRTHTKTKGRQDVDYTSQAPIDYIPVENITFPDLSLLPDGVYTFKAHNWDFRNTGHGFKSEIAFGNQVLEFDYDKVLQNKEWVTLAKIELKRGEWKVLESLPTIHSTKEVWNIQTQQFHPVTVIMNSPNYWDGQVGIGNKHYFFMLKDCINPTNPSGFFNEYLKPELYEYRKMIEALINKLRVEDSQQQLSGLGFSETLDNSVIVKVTGQMSRPLRIVFNR